MAGPERLAPREFAAAMTYRDIARARAKQGPWQSERGRRAIRDADLHKLFRTGRELLDYNADGSPKLDEAGNRVVHRLTAIEAKNAIVLVGLVKKVAGLDPYYETSDKELCARARRDLGPGWSLATVRRTRRVCYLAGLEVRPRVLSELSGLRERGLTGWVWVLDRRRLALVENAIVPESSLNRAVVNPDHTPSLYARAKSPLPPVGGAEKPLPRAGPAVPEASAVVKAALRELRSEERRRRRAQPTPAERLDGPTTRLLMGLFVERWKVRSEWGDAAALAQASDRALALRADPERVAAARAHLARLLLGEQLRLEGIGEPAQEPREGDEPPPGAPDIGGEERPSDAQEE